MYDKLINCLLNLFCVVWQGIDSNSGRPYEDLFCKGSGQRGVIALGDSVSAHFHIPKEWVLPNKLGNGVLEHLPFVVENQLDWPMMSAFTGVISDQNFGIFKTKLYYTQCLLGALKYGNFFFRLVIAIWTYFFQYPISLVREKNSKSQTIALKDSFFKWNI